MRGRHSVPEVCYRVERRGRAFFFGGDTMLTPEIEALAAERPVPFAILPGERSRLLWRRYVMTPEEAVGLAQRLGATRAVLTHHEQRACRDAGRFGWMVTHPARRTSRTSRPGSWCPAPGDFVPFPWDDSARKEAVS